MNAKIWIILAGLLGSSGVAMGAFHAHGLEKFLTQRMSVEQDAPLSEERLTERLDYVGTAVRYQLTHALALLGVGLLAGRTCGGCATLSGILRTVGTLLFSGLLYALGLFDVRLHWSLIPGGGLCLILGWLSLIPAGLKIRGEPGTGKV